MKIVVVGAGVVGLACAYELLLDGHDVVVLDQGPAGRGASHGNAAKIAHAEAGPVPAPGMVAQGLRWMLKTDSPLYVRPSLSPSFIRFMVQMARGCNEASFRAGLALNLRLAERAPEIFDEWRSAGLDFEMHSRGVLLAWENEDHFRSRLAYQEVFDAHGVHAEVLDENSIRGVEPALADSLRFGLFYPGDRQIEPDSLVAALVGKTTELGGRVLEHDPVARIDSDGAGRVRAVLTTAGGRHACDGVVVAAGVWSAGLVAQLGMRIPLRPGKGYSVDYTPAPVQLRTSLTLEDAHIAITPLEGMIRVAGTMEFSGMDESIRSRRVTAIMRAAASGLRGWDIEAPHQTAWMGLRPMTPDGLPIIGPVAEGANIWLATGHAMLGLTQAPTTARLVRDLVRGSATVDPGLSPNRYASRRQLRPRAAG